MIAVFFVVVLLVFFVCGTTIAVLSRKLMREGFEEFVVAGYRVGGFLSAMTYAATTYSAFMMVGLVGLTYATGVAALGFELVYLVATIGILSTIGLTIWKKARERKWVSPSEMIGDLYGSKALAAIVSVLYLVILTPYLAAQLKGVGELFNAIGLGYEIGVIFTALAVFLWIAIAGLWSVAATDAFQGIWMILTSIAVILWATAFLLPSRGLNLVTALTSLSQPNKSLLSFTWTTSMFIGMSLPWIFFAITNPQVVQRLYIPKDGQAYRRMVKYFATYGFIYTLICVFLGLIFRSYMAIVDPNLEQQLIKARDSVTPTVLLQAHTILSSTTFVGITAAAISTANSIVLTAASAVVKDLYLAYTRDKEENKAMIVTYITAILMVLIASIIALQKIAYIVELSVLSSALLLPLAPITIAGVYLEPRKRGLPYAIASMILGLVVMGTVVATQGPLKTLTTPIFLGMPAPLWGLLASFIPIFILYLEIGFTGDRETQ